MNAVAEKETPTVTTQPAQPANVESRFVAPQVNIVETKEGYVLEAEMPGVNKEGLSVNLEANVLTLEGRRQAQNDLGAPLYRESRNAAFRRVFALDSDIDSARISAQIENGVVTMQLPKAEKVKPRKISVN